jgi:soluble lytic murein transglycosylase-like protein
MKKLIMGLLLLAPSLLGYANCIITLPLNNPNLEKLQELDKALQMRDSLADSERKRILYSDSLATEEKGKLVMAIILQESGNNPKAIDKSGTSKGNMQITRICLKEANRLLGYAKYKIKDVFNPRKSLEIFWIIQKQYNPSFNFEMAARIWNGGPRGMKMKSTQKYWKGIKDKFKKVNSQTQSYANLVINNVPKFYYERG